MKKVLIGLAAVGSVVGLLFAARQMKAHFSEMAAHCKEMASRNGSSESPSEREVEEIKKQRVAAPTA